MMWRIASLLLAATALGAPAAGHVSHSEAGLHSGKTQADAAQVNSHSPRHVLRPGEHADDHVAGGIAAPERRPKARQAHRHPLTLLRTSRTVPAANRTGEERPKEEALSTHVAGRALGALANSTAERWRLIASGRMPAELPKKEAVGLTTSTQRPSAAKGAGGDANRSKPEAAHHQMQELAGDPLADTSKGLWGYHAKAHGDDDDEKQSWPTDEYSGGGKDKYHEPREVLGLPKIFWALVANVIAMACFIACIPFILSVAKRRRPISSS